MIQQFAEIAFERNITCANRDSSIKESNKLKSPIIFIDNINPSLIDYANPSRSLLCEARMIVCAAQSSKILHSSAIGPVVYFADACSTC